jgi:hypothetical protein
VIPIWLSLGLIIVTLSVTTIWSLLSSRRQGLAERAAGDRAGTDPVTAAPEVAAAPGVAVAPEVAAAPDVTAPLDAPRPESRPAPR